MSKKKVTGSTMTLKDFHGGSIPSDLPLPSAPGVIVRNSDRSGMDRSIPSVWGSPINRTEYRRPGSAGNSRGFDDKAAFFSQPAHIGLNFDEDERKPLDSGPRRNTVDGDNRNARSDRFMSNRVDSVLTESKVSVRPSVASRPAVLQARPSSGGGVPAGAPNAWGMRKESGFQEEIPSQMPYSTQSVAAKLATASAVDKVSSGKWQSKLIVSQVPRSPSPPPIYQSEVESRSLGRYNEIGSSSFPSASNPPGVDLDPGNNKNHYSNVRFSEEQKYREEGVQNTGRGYGGDYDSVRHGRPVSSEGKTGTQGVQEVSERPKLKLLPRSKPMEQQDLQVKDQKHDAGNVEVYDEGISNVAHPQSVGSVAGDASGKAVERPKLNLKPRSQPVDQSDETAERERNALFGGARPRELVLKERGVDDTVINCMDSVPVRPTSSGKHDSHQPDAKTEQPNARAGERSETFTGNRRTGQVERMDVTERRDYERKDHRADPERADAQRNTRRNDNWRNEKDVEKNQERNRPEVDSWRKPEPMTSPEPQATRHSQVASAMELAQAFSKSVSVAKPDKIINQRSLPSRLVDNGSVPAQAPVLFSRLTDGHRQINGY